MNISKALTDCIEELLVLLVHIMHALMSLISLAESLNHHLVHRKLVLNVCLRFEWALCFGHVISSHFILLGLAHFSALA